MRCDAIVGSALRDTRRTDGETIGTTRAKRVVSCVCVCVYIYRERVRERRAVRGVRRINPSVINRALPARGLIDLIARGGVRR